MSTGSLAICNDLFGVIESTDDDTCNIVDKYGETHKVKCSAVHEVCNPHALAYFLYNKIVLNKET